MAVSTLYSTAKSLLQRLKNDERGLNWHANCRRTLLVIVEAYTDDESNDANESFDRKLQLFTNNLNIIFSSLLANVHQNHPPLSTANESRVNGINDADCCVRDCALSDPPSAVSDLPDVTLQDILVETESESSTANDDASDDMSDVIVVETIDDGDDDGDTIAVADALYKASDEIMAEYEDIIPGLFDDEVEGADCDDFGKRWWARPIGDSPELMPLDNSLNQDIHELVRRYVVICCVLFFVRDLNH